MTVQISTTLEKGTPIVINSLGLESHKSLRDQQDGFVYFGCKKSIKNENNDHYDEAQAKEVVNDFKL